MSGFVLAIGRLLERNDALLKHGIVLLVTSTVGNLLNYLYQLSMGRMLGPEQYGVFGAIISLTYVLTVPVQTIQTTTTKSVSKLRAAGRNEDLGFLIRSLAKRVSLGSLLGMVAILAASGVIAQFLQIPSAIPVVILGVAFFCQLVAPTFNGALLGLQRFFRLGANQIVNFGSKMVFGLTLVAVGFGVGGALAGMIVGGALSILLGAYFLRDVLQRTPSSREVLMPSFYSIYTFLAFFSITLFYNMDVMLVKRFFDSAQAGYYTAASTLAKAIFFGSIAIAGAMFPKVSAWHEEGNGFATTKLLRHTLIYVGGLAGVGTLVLNVFPRLAVSILYGASYEKSVPLVGLFSIGMLLFSLSYVLVLYLLALDRKGFLLVLTVGGAMEVGGIVLFHTTLLQVVTIFAGTMGLVFLSLAGFTLHYNPRCSIFRGKP